MLRPLGLQNRSCQVLIPKKTRIVHQVTACVLFDVLKSPYESSNNENLDESIECDTNLQCCKERKVGNLILSFDIRFLKFSSWSCIGSCSHT